MTVTVRQTKVRGVPKWVVDRAEEGKRKRSFFETKKSAEDEAARLRREIKETGISWSEISATDRSEIISVFSEARARGLSLRSVWEAYKNGAGQSVRESRTLADAIKETIDSKTAAKRRPKYLKSLSDYLRKFAAGRETLPVSRITPADIERWVVDRKESPSARASNMGRLSAMFDLCFRRDYISFNPCDKVERIRVTVGRPVIFSASESSHLVETCWKTDTKMLPYIILGLYCGIRPEECQKLKWSDVDLEKSRITIHESVSKIHRWRYVPIAPVALAWLEKCDKRASLIPNVKTLRRRRKRLCKRAGLKWTQNILRKTAASFMMAKYQDAAIVAEFLGDSPRMLRRHYRDLVAPEESEIFWKETVSCTTQKKSQSLTKKNSPSDP